MKKLKSIFSAGVFTILSLSFIPQSIVHAESSTPNYEWTSYLETVAGPPTAPVTPTPTAPGDPVELENTGASIVAYVALGAIVTAAVGALWKTQRFAVYRVRW